MDMRQYQIKHTGWLLACDAPSNQAKGRRLLSLLSHSEQQLAEDYATECRAVYARLRPQQQEG